MVIQAFNELSAWCATYRAARIDLDNGMEGALTAFIHAGKFPCDTGSLMQLALAHPMLAQVVSEMLGGVECWEAMLSRPIAQEGDEYTNWPELVKAPGKPVRIVEQAVETIQVLGKFEPRYNEDYGQARKPGQFTAKKSRPARRTEYAQVSRRTTWVSAEGCGWTTTDERAARLGGWYKVNQVDRTRLRMTNAGRKHMRVFGWKWPKPIVVPFAPGAGTQRINFAPADTTGWALDAKGDVMFAHRRKWMPMAFKYDWARRSGKRKAEHRFVGWTSEYVVKPYGLAKGTPIVPPRLNRNRMDKVRFAQRDYRLRDVVGYNVKTLSFGEVRQNAKYHPLSVEQRQGQQERRVIRAIEFAVTFLRKTLGAKRANAALRKLQPHDIVMLADTIRSEAKYSAVVTHARITVESKLGKARAKRKLRKLRPDQIIQLAAGYESCQRNLQVA